MYLDPGFGGMLVQILVAIVAAGGVLAFSLRRKIRKLFSKKKDDNTGDTTVNAVSANTSNNANETDNDVIDVLSDNKADEG